MIRVALDSNILAYSSGVRRVPEDDAKIDRARGLLRQLADCASLVTPVQAIGELFVVMRRSGFPADQVRQAVVELTESIELAGSATETLLVAADLVVDHKLQFWDALIVAASANAGCALLLSEDMQNGFVVRGMTVVNPLVEPVHPKLASLLDMASDASAMVEKKPDRPGSAVRL